MPPRQHRTANPSASGVSSLTMSRTSPKSKGRQHASAPTLAKALAPEEIRAGDFVIVLHEIVEWPSWIWCDDATLGSREEVVRVCVTPRDAAAPLEVCSVCLPFVLVREPCRRERIVDIRRHRLARLDSAFARIARRACRRALKKRYRTRAASALL
jgi:hypothetical protein